MANARDMSFLLTATEAVQPFTRELVGFPPGNLFLTVETQDIRFWYGGTVPTPTSGHPLENGSSVTFTKMHEIENLWLISTVGEARINATVSGA